MVDQVEKGLTSPEEGWLELLAYYQQLELAINDEDSDTDQINSLVMQSEELFNQLKTKSKTGEKNQAEKDELTKIYQKSQKLITLLINKKGDILNQLNSLKSGKSALSAYQKPRCGMGYTEGKFLDNKK